MKNLPIFKKSELIEDLTGNFQNFLKIFVHLRTCVVMKVLMLLIIFSTTLSLSSQSGIAYTEQDLRDLIENASPYDITEITLGASITLTDVITINLAEETTVIIVGNGNTITQTIANTRHFFLYGLWDSQLILYDVILDGGNLGGGIDAYGKLIVKNSTIKNCKAEWSNGGAINAFSHLEVTHSTIMDNEAGYSGGGIYAMNSWPCIISHSAVTGNKASSSGGGIFYTFALPTKEGEKRYDLDEIMAFGNVLYISNSTIAANESGGFGGGIYCQAGLVVSGKVNISENTADYSGGGVFKNSYQPLQGHKLELLEIEKNTALNDGGGIYTYSNIDLTSGTVNISDNEADYYGGGIYLNATAQFGGNTTISGNRSENGGGIYVDWYGWLQFKDDGIIIFSHNKAGNEGGAIYTGNPLYLYIENNVTFSHNSAQYAYLLDASHPDDYLYISHSDILDHCLLHVTPAAISLVAPFQYAYNNYDINYVGGDPVGGKSPYEIWNWADLAYINVLIENENKTPPVSPKLSDYEKFILMQDLGFPAWPINYGSDAPYEGSRKYGFYGYENIYGDAPGDDNTLIVGDSIATIAQAWDNNGWIQLGKWNSNPALIEPFTGLLIGNNKTINGLWLDRPLVDGMGLFGAVDNATIENLGIGVGDKGITGGNNTGGLAGYINNSTIANCYVANYKGGPPAVTKGPYDDVPVPEITVNKDNISGNNNVGALAGSVSNATISSCYTTVDIYGDNSVGGLVGNAYNSTSFTDCYATGYVAGKNAVGGFVGLFGNASSINTSYATGVVSGIDLVGGLVGELNDANIINSFAFNPKIAATTNLGRIAGNADGAITLNNNEAFDCMEVSLDGIHQIILVPTPDSDNIHGADISYEDAINPTTFATWTGSDVWTLDYYNWPYSIRIGFFTNLPVLKVFNTVAFPLWETAIQPPSIFSNVPLFGDMPWMPGDYACKGDGYFNYPLYGAPANPGFYKYQWYRNTSQSTVDAVAIDGATEAQYLPPTNGLEPGDYYFYVLVSSPCSPPVMGPISSAYTILDMEINISLSSTSPAPVCEGMGDFPELSIDIDGYYYSVEWYRNTTGTPTNEDEYVSWGDTYIPSYAGLPPGDYYYYAVVWSDCGKRLSNMSGTHTVKQVPTIAITTDAVCSGTTITHSDYATSALGTIKFYATNDCSGAEVNSGTAAAHPYTYSVQAELDGCYSDCELVSITVYPAITEAITYSVVCNSYPVTTGTLTVTHPASGSGYTYSLNDGSFGTDPVFLNVANGNTHTITIKDANGCTKTLSNVTVNCECENAPTLTLAQATESTCVTTKVTVTGNTYTNASGVTITHDGTGNLDATSVTTTPFSIGYTPGADDAGNTVTITVTTTGHDVTCEPEIETLTLTVLPTTAITAQPSDDPQQVCQGTATFPTLTVTATGNDLTYEWFINTTGDPADGGTSVGTGTSHTPSTTALTVGVEYYYYVVVTGTCGEVTSGVSGAHTVKATPAVITSIISFPCVGYVVNHETYAKPNVGTINYYATNDCSGTPLGNTSEVLTTGTYTYYAQAEHNGCFSDCEEITLTVLTTPVITVEPSKDPQVVCEGTSSFPTLNITATGVGTPAMIEWYRNTTGDASGGELVGFGMAAYSHTPLTADLTVGVDYYYYVVVYGVCGQVTSEVSGAHRVGSNTITQPNPANDAICSGATKTFTLGAATGGEGTITYQWQQSATGADGTWNPADAPNNQQNYTTSTLTSQMYYRRVATGEFCGTHTTTPALITISGTAPTFTFQPSADPQQVCNGTASFPTLSVTATGHNLSYEWFRNTTGDPADGGTSVGTGISHTPSTTDLTAGISYFYYVVVTNDCGETRSNVSGLHRLIQNHLTFNAHTSQSVCEGEKGYFPRLVLTAYADVGYNYVWYRNTTNANIGGDIVCAVCTNFYDPPYTGLAPGDYYYYAVITRAGCDESRSGVSAKHTVTAKTIPAFDFPDNITYCSDATPHTLPLTSTNGITGTWDVSPIEMTVGGPTPYTFTPDPDQCADVKTITVRVNEYATTANITVNNETICQGETATLTATASGVTSPIFRWYASQIAPTPIHIGASYSPTPIATTTYFVSVSGSNLCENKTDDRQPVTVTVEICDLLNCDAMPDRFAEEDDYLAKVYTHFGTAWDAIFSSLGLVDEISYYINGTLFSSGVGSSLNGAEFATGVSKVMVIAKYMHLEDTCRFNVTVNRTCLPTIFDDEGNEYKVTKLAGLCWTENLKATKYAVNLGKGSIPFAKPYYSTLYPDTNYHFEVFGLLYDWHSAVGEVAGHASVVQGICPEGWHVPSVEEWERLDAFFADDLKSKEYWLLPGSDKYGFSALPSGWYNSTTCRFEDLYGYTDWWARDGSMGQTAQSYSLNYFCKDTQKNVNFKGNGLSVRCVANY